MRYHPIHLGSKLKKCLPSVWKAWTNVNDISCWYLLVQDCTQRYRCMIVYTDTHIYTSPDNLSNPTQGKCLHIRNNAYALLPLAAVKDKELLQKLHEKGRWWSLEPTQPLIDTGNTIPRLLISHTYCTHKFFFSISIETHQQICLLPQPVTWVLHSSEQGNAKVVYKTGPMLDSVLLTRQIWEGRMDKKH